VSTCKIWKKTSIFVPLTPKSRDSSPVSAHWTPAITAHCALQNAIDDLWDGIVSLNVFWIKSYNAVKPGFSLDSNFCAEVVVEQAGRHALTVGFMQDLHCVRQLLITYVLNDRQFYALCISPWTVNSEHVCFSPRVTRVMIIKVKFGVYEEPVSPLFHVKHKHNSNLITKVTNSPVNISTISMSMCCLCVHPDGIPIISWRCLWVIVSDFWLLVTIVSVSSQLHCAEMESGLEFRRNLERQKTGVPGLSYNVVCVILCLTILVELRLVTDGQTDGRTDTRPRHIDYRASIASRSKNTKTGSNYVSNTLTHDPTWSGQNCWPRGPSVRDPWPGDPIPTQRLSLTSTIITNNCYVSYKSSGNWC